MAGSTSLGKRHKLLLITTTNASNPWPLTVDCPICGKAVASFFINSHIDSNCFQSSSQLQPSPPESSAPSAQVSASTSTLKRKQQTPSSSIPSTINSSPLSSSNLTSTSNQTHPQQPPSKKFKSNEALTQAKPLAELVRPSTLDDLIGQEQLLGQGAMLRTLIDKDRVGSLIFWGPPGTGKTTIARVIAGQTKSVFKELSATNASTADLRKVFDEAANLLKLTGRKTILFIDEIQRFSKAQQDNFLPPVEAGLISLIASTTENPSFRLNNALLSRCRVFILEKLSTQNLIKVLQRALRITGKTSEETKAIDEDLLRFLAAAADGDARVAITSLELALAATADREEPLGSEELKRELRRAHLQYDRSGDLHYDTISALHKSVRGGDANAALYWLARMLEGGDDPLYVARRLIRMASEDVGNANPSALPQAVAAYQATQLIGMPECDCILAQVVVMLAESPKSVRTYQAYNEAKKLVKETENHPVPLHIRNAPTGLMKSLGYGKDYLYNPSFAHPVYQTYLPPELESKAEFLKPDESMEGKMWDVHRLEEWEVKMNGGQMWEGRETTMRKMMGI
ncbi:P-loop containing nucleoside triphosphate hydrolase protein [Meredithblackwellia eburnea MCA 4105]